ncbi:hypothetical protein K443DRAFT_347580 [Laccaria amethystina LaAM-08-1]|uniref:Uncharacterized protein n=1 Tax=Laccaria amethystina LaAM-08-1 TaxID=1095629 RepID=A0A0C9XFC1_9AGAR|nr:hypothetical protein K443DRAFT_347580 [Laccaria amethystina LaAM-08-1]
MLFKGSSAYEALLKNLTFGRGLLSRSMLTKKKDRGSLRVKTWGHWADLDGN